MYIKNRRVIVYDVEVFPNVFHCCCKDTEDGTIYKFEISERKNQITELVDFILYTMRQWLFERHRDSLNRTGKLH